MGLPIRRISSRSSRPTGRWDLKKFFRFWLTQNAHPVVDCRVSREGKQIRLDLDYRNADILAWEQHIPVAVYRRTLLLKRGKRHVRYRISGGEDDIFVVLDASLETLAEIRPHKDRSMWVAQLRYGPRFYRQGAGAVGFGGG